MEGPGARDISRLVVSPLDEEWVCRPRRRARAALTAPVTAKLERAQFPREYRVTWYASV